MIQDDADIPDDETGPALLPEPHPRKPRFRPYRGLPFALSLRWLGAGVLLYALLLLVAMAGSPDYATWPVVGPSVYLTPAFGLPLVLATLHRPGRTRRIVFFLIALPLAHLSANYIAWSHALGTYSLDRGSETALWLRSGAWGGVTGATLSFTLLHLSGLTARRRTELLVMALGTAALTALGAGAMMAGLSWSGAPADMHNLRAAIIWFEIVHPPWQLVFALCIAWLTRTVRPAKAAAIGRTAPST